MDQNKGTNSGRRFLIILLAAVMLGSGGLSLKHYMDSQKAREEYGRLSDLARETTAVPRMEEPAGTRGKVPEEEPYVSPVNFDKLKAENPETIGWIRIADTNIDYPIVQGTDNDFYLNHDFYGKESVGGSIYLDFESQNDFVGRNNILYGHNMKDGSMFKDVILYKDEKYFKEHQFFSIYTPDREIRLKAVACYYGEAQPIVRKTRFKSQESFDAFVYAMLEPCIYAGAVTYPAKTLYTLVTCSYEINDARTFLFAVEVDDSGNEVRPDEDFLKKMDDLMKAAARETSVPAEG